MKLYLLDLWERLKNASIIKKIIFLLIFLIEIFLLVICLVKVNVEVVTPGSLNNPVNSLTIENSNERGYIASIGIFSYKKVSLLQYWLSKNNKKFEVSEIDDTYYISLKEETAQGKLLKDNSIVLALINAYKEASKVDDSISIDISDLYVGETVIAIYSYSNTTLEYGDVITEINGKAFNNHQEFVSLVKESLLENKYLQMKVLRNDNTVEAYANVSESEGYKNYGFSIDSCYKFPETQPNYTFSKNYSSIGPSAGMITTLAIYNMLLKEDITKGYKITGTGTINFDGTCGLIGGIEQKLITAQFYNVDIFFVDSGDYNDAKAFYLEHGCSFELVSIEKFTDIIDYLNHLEAKNGN